MREYGQSLLRTIKMLVPVAAAFGLLVGAMEIAQHLSGSEAVGHVAVLVLFVLGFAGVDYWERRNRRVEG